MKTKKKKAAHAWQYGENVRQSISENEEIEIEMASVS